MHHFLSGIGKTSATLQKYDAPDKKYIFITHTFADPTVVAAVRKKLLDYGFADENIHETIAGSTPSLLRSTSK